MLLLIVLALTLMMAGVAVLLALRATDRQRQEDVNLRLRVLGNAEDAATVAAQLSSAQQVHNPLLRFFCHVVWRTGVEYSPQTVLRLLLGILLLLPLLLLVLGVALGLLVFVGGLGLGWLLLLRQAGRRRRRIIEQFPAFLESVSRVLAAGNTLEEAISSSVREAPDPIRPLFVSVGRQVRLGAPIETVLHEQAEINELRDLKILAMAASINRKYGGSLRSVLRSLIQAVRARDNAQRELRALTAETRFSAMVLSVIPIVIMIYIVWQNPDYYTQMWQQLSGKILLGGSLVLQVLGMLLIWRMMRGAGGDS
ncbi:tight adherence protein B [Solimonas aquatica]|uniref:Tight adherence protein B n=1 Tax=Solimonas aquatica TaxID=489703 RepID=A0A1H9H4K1_9GAMM|nr:type II secretion system F family protein [Solimonas aquatica]SEQ57167.1 tight adherence protein B [Solimonas aquatica]